MRIVLFVILFLGLVGSSVYFFTDDDGAVSRLIHPGKKDTQKQESSNPVSSFISSAVPSVIPTPLPSESKPVARVQRADAFVSDTTPKDERPFSIASFQFTHRTPPDIQWFQQWSTREVVVSIDPQTRTVTLTGPPRYVLACTDALKQLDQPLGDCAVQSWC